MRQLAGLFTLFLFLFVLLSVSALADHNPNDPAFWGPDCFKIDESQGETWTADRDYRLVVAKAGTINHEFYNVTAGTVINVGKDISHLILCTGGFSSTTTTILSSTTMPSTTTTIPNSTTTTGDTTTSSLATTTSSTGSVTTTTLTITTTTEESETTTTTTQPSSTTTLVDTTTTVVDETTTTSQPATTSTTDPPKEIPLTGVPGVQIAAVALLLLLSGLTLNLAPRLLKKSRRS